jgi:uncharacterized protein (TIGR02391 family)
MKTTLESKKLKMSFDPLTIEHLGIKMYSNIAPAISELIANAYDADAKNVSIKLYDDGEKQKIEVFDDGDGMTFADINNYFLVIGRNRRKEGLNKSPSGKRKVTGKKGLGKLALFGIGKTIEIETTKRNSKKTTFFTLNWNDIVNTHNKNYEPPFHDLVCKKSKHGTIVRLSNLNKRIDLKKSDLAVEISRLFNFTKPDFKVYLIHNDDNPLLIHNKLKYQNLDQEFEWYFPEYGKKVGKKYKLKSKIRGRIITTKKPIKPGLRGISLFANGRLVNVSEYFGVSESSHGYSYMTGWLDVDFVDEWEEDVIATDRQTLNWNLPNTSALREYLKKCMSTIEKDWHEKRNKAREEKITSLSNVNIKNWYNRLPREVLTSIKPVINSIFEKSELPDEDQGSIVRKLHDLIPDYPYYHWRHLHSTIHSVAEDDYKEKDYYRAAQEAVKKYISEVQRKSKAKNLTSGKILDGKDLMFNAFGENGILRITSCKKQSEIDLEQGQQHLSAGVVSGFRNPTSHENKGNLHPHMFSDKDCLDILSLISYLFGKLDKSRKRKSLK